MHPSRGVIYISTGDKSYAEALNSVRSLKTHNPQLSVTMYTDSREPDPIFDNFVIIEQPLFSVLDKAVNISKTPYEETLYIDSDTYITGDLGEYFDVLKHCDFAGTIESARGFWYEGKMDIPRALCDINGGVLCFKRTPAVMEALKQWYPEYQKTAGWLEEYGPDNWYLTNDQPSLRKLIWTNREIRVAILPDEYNALRLFGTRLWGDARIVHGRGKIDRIAREMNEQAGSNRIFLQGGGTMRPTQDVSVWAGLKQCFRIFASIIYYKCRIFDSRLYQRLRNNKKSS